MEVLNRKFVAELQERNREARIQRHPQIEEIQTLVDRMRVLYDEIEVETDRRVRCGITVRINKQ